MKLLTTSQAEARLIGVFFVLTLTASFIVGGATTTFAQSPQGARERLCDTSFEDCRAPLIDLIRAETQGIDIGYWTLSDGGLASELIKRHKAGVTVRVLADTRSSDNGANAFSLQLTNQLAAEGIPIRRKRNGSYQHWKTVIFAGQQIVEFSGANFGGLNFKPYDPYKYYNDEVIYFSDLLSVVNSFKTEFENRWTDTSNLADYANITETPSRRYPVSAIDPEISIGAADKYFSRLLPLLRAETKQIDALMFRITDERPADELIAAFNRGVSVRLMSDIEEYRDPKRLWHAYNLDRLYAAGLTIRIPKHAGQNHEKAVMLGEQEMVIFGSQNWGSSMQEHNYFTRRPWFFEWFMNHFNRKWNGTNPLGVQEYKLFVPKTPPAPVNQYPAADDLGIPTSLVLKWEGSAFAHKFDILFGTDSQDLQPLVTDARYALADDNLSPVLKSGSPELNVAETYQLPRLLSETTYYWQIVGKTMANKQTKSSVWSFTTAGNYPSPSTPTNLIAIGASATQANLSWSNVANERGYKIERSANGADWTAIATVNADTTIFQDTDATDESLYRVRAYNASGYSSYSNTAAVETLPVNTFPVAPSNLIVVPVSEVQLNLTWADNSSNESAFEVEQSLDGNNFTLYATTNANATAYASAQHRVNTTYFYRVRAVSATNGNSAYSNTVQATTFNLSTLPVPADNLTATAASSTAIVLNWSDNSNNEVGFRIERSLDGVRFRQFHATGANETTIRDSGLLPNKVYYYRLRSYNRTGNATAYSNITSAKTRN